MDIKELALKVAKEMNWRMDEMTLETFATRLIAAYLAEQKPVAWWGSMWIMGSGPNPFHTCKICGEKHPAVEIVLAEHAESHLFRAPPEPAPDWLLKTAQNLAQHMAKEFFPDVPQFEVLDDLAGVISQIDNMVCGLPREPILCAAPSSEEVDEVVERLRTYPTRQHLIAADLIERLAARVPDGCVEKYNELLYAVERKFPNETRHETTLRYIKERERRDDAVASLANTAKVEPLNNPKQLRE